MNTSSRNRLATAAALVLLCAGPVFAQWQAGQRLPNLAAMGLPPATTAALAGKVVLLDFWASWCGPCKESFPILNRLQETYGPRGFTVLAVSVDEDAAQMTRFLEEHPAAFPIAHDARQKLVESAAIEAMPSSFLVDRAGTIRFVHAGFRPESTPEELVREIESLLPPEAAP